MQIEYHDCHNCIHWDPSKEFCEHGKPKLGMAGLFSCENWAQREESVPLQPDGSLKMKASETIGCRIVNGDGITAGSITTGLIKRCSNCANYMPAIGICRQKDMIISNPDSWACGDKWEPKTEEQNLEKTLHIEYDIPEIPKDTMKALSEFMSNDGSIVRARMLESLDIVFGLAIQQAPTLKERWISLREQCIGALQMRWKQEDEKKDSKP